MQVRRAALQASGPSPRRHPNARSQPTLRSRLQLDCALLPLPAVLLATRPPAHRRRRRLHTFGGDSAADVVAARSADVVLAVHGAGCTNWFYMAPGSALLELRPHQFGSHGWADSYFPLVRPRGAAAPWASPALCVWRRWRGPRAACTSQLQPCSPAAALLATERPPLRPVSSAVHSQVGQTGNHSLLWYGLNVEDPAASRPSPNEAALPAGTVTKDQRLMRDRHTVLPLGALRDMLLRVAAAGRDRGRYLTQRAAGRHYAELHPGGVLKPKCGPQAAINPACTMQPPPPEPAYVPREEREAAAAAAAAAAAQQQAEAEAAAAQWGRAFAPVLPQARPWSGIGLRERPPATALLGAALLLLAAAAVGRSLTGGHKRQPALHRPPPVASLPTASPPAASPPASPGSPPFLNAPYDQPDPADRP